MLTINRGAWLKSIAAEFLGTYMCDCTAVMHRQLHSHEQLVKASHARLLETGTHEIGMHAVHRRSIQSSVQFLLTRFSEFHRQHLCRCAGLLYHDGSCACSASAAMLTSWTNRCHSSPLSPGVNALSLSRSRFPVFRLFGVPCGGCHTILNASVHVYAQFCQPMHPNYPP